MKNAYTLKEHKLTGEYHIFVGNFLPKGSDYPCNSNYLSDCKEMTKNDSKRNIFTCEDEQNARELCAKYGRKVCANCIRELYKTINKKF